MPNSPRGHRVLSSYSGRFCRIAVTMSYQCHSTLVRAPAPPYVASTLPTCYADRVDIAAIRTYGLTRRFGELTAVEDLNFSVATGQFFGFLGPNGAGKSTTIQMLTGLLEPSAGYVEILGERFTASSLDLKRQIGV